MSAFHVRVRGVAASPRVGPTSWFRRTIVLLVLAPLPVAAAPCDRAPSLADVLERVAVSPRAAAAASDTDAQRELVRQAGVRPNPDLRLEIEDFTGSGGYSEFGRTQTTLSFAQRIELGGVRDRRVDAASREVDAVAAQGVSELAAAAATAKQRYVELAARAASVAAAGDAERLTREFLAETEKRGASAVASEADVARARVSSARAALDLQEKKRELAIAAERLSAAWGGTSEDAACYATAATAGKLPLPAAARATTGRADVAGAPAVLAADAEMETKRAEVELARAQAAPDLEIGAGLRHHAPSDVSAVAELRVELPFFDRGEGAIAAAERRLSAAQSRALAARRETETRVARLRETLEAAAARERAITSQMIPSAEAAAASLTRAWQSGAASTFEMIDARRSVLELREQRIEAASEYWRTLAALEALTGQVSPTLGVTPARGTED
jgi:cobalt-zinc-cadmium efflux system outer membrane protein